MFVSEQVSLDSTTRFHRCRLQGSGRRNFTKGGRSRGFSRRPDVTWYMRKEAELFGLMQRFELSLSKRMQVLLSDTNWLEEFRRETLTLKSESAWSYSVHQSNLNNNLVSEIRLEKDHSAQTRISDRVTRRNSLELLSGREDHVLRLISRGLTSKQIALELGLSVATVSAHRRNIKKKLQMKTSLEVARYALLRFPFDADEMAS